MDVKSISILEQFKVKKSLYEEFLLALYKLTESLLSEGEYKYQILYRVKGLDELEEKIIRKQKTDRAYHALDEIEDLAGLRIIFYFEVDKIKFLNELKKEIDGDLKINLRKKKSGYEAIHIIASFGSKRTSLSEYKKFEDLKCEIQLTSILHHAWSEIEHHLIYKNSFGITSKKQLSTYREAMRRILKTHLKKATDEFDEIFKQIKSKSN